MMLPEKSELCNLYEVKVLRPVQIEESEDVKSTNAAKILNQKVDEEEDNIAKALGVKLDDTNLTGSQKKKMHDLLRKWKHIFSTGPTDLGHTDLIEHEIKLSDNTPFKEPYRNIPPGLFNEVKEHLKEILC